MIPDPLTVPKYAKQETVKGKGLATVADREPLDSGGN
jgi:hypothetical protein